jgi:hypothetical protein
MTIWDDNEFPLAYLITFRTYGTWLHGDGRGSIDRYHNEFRGPRVQANEVMKNQQKAKLKSNAVTLNAAQRSIVKKAICGVCAHRGWKVYAINVRTNHAHVVVSAPVLPENIVRDFSENQLWSYTHSPWLMEAARDISGNLGR